MSYTVGSLPHGDDVEAPGSVDSYEILEPPREEEFAQIIMAFAKAYHVLIALIPFLSYDRSRFEAVMGKFFKKEPVDRFRIFSIARMTDFWLKENNYSQSPDGIAIVST